MLQGLVVGVMSLDPASALLLHHMSLILFVCAVVRCALTPSYSQPPADKKRLVFLRDFPHLLCVYIFFILSLSTSCLNLFISLSHTPTLASLLLFFSVTHLHLLMSVCFFSSLSFACLVLLLSDLLVSLLISVLFQSFPNNPLSLSLHFLF